MPDFFETDDIVKDYDSTVVARIFSYVKPYRALLAWAVLALVLSTLGELLLPVLVQRTIDDSLVVSWSALAPGAYDDARLAGVLEDQDVRKAGGSLFVRRTRLSSLADPVLDALVSGGLVDPGPFYLTPWTDVAALPENIRRETVASSVAIDGPFLADGWFVAPEAYILALAPGDARSLRVADRRVVALNGSLFMMLLVTVLLSTFVQTWTTSLIGQKVMKDLRMDLFRHTTAQSLSFLSRQPVGRLVTRLTSDVETINEFFTSVVVAFVKDISIMAGVLGVLFVMSPRLAFVTALSLPPVLFATTISRRKARDAFRRQRTWLSKVNAFIAEHVSGVSVVKLFCREAASAAEFEKHDRELLNANLGEMYVFATFRPLIEFFSSTSVAVILWFGAGMHGRNLITLGTLIAFVNLIRMFYEPLQDISEKYTLLQSAMAGGERVFKLLDSDDRVPDQAKLAMPDFVRGHIEFRNVWFAYRGEDWVIKDLSFKVEPGETVAIVGYTGAGKSTVAALLARLWDVQKGGIFLDGTAVQDLPLGGLRSAIRPVMQDVFLFSGTVAENIDLGLNLPREALERAALAVNADGFIGALPDGYDTRLGEGAATLSSGQRQLLSFARVVAHDPSIVVLDEATSSVDTETERLVQQGLEELMRGRTTVAIAHRLSTIRHADRILVMSEGRLAEEGDHDSLIAKGGIYYNLYRLQYERETEETA
ncbi:MAG: ABC transporter ATP-binding protein [Spirochaetia bacterium]|jgi:ATP-binding cassette subfamily B protein|nr:ABC transporter ATP-binding protein [Spirochaetia bacterium]